MNIYFDYNTPTTVTTNEKAINNSIKNILLTQIGSLPGKPTFGSNVPSVLFNFIDGVSQEVLKGYIVSALTIWEPRITILDIKVNNIPEYNKITVDIRFQYELLGKNLKASTNIVLKD